MLGIRDTLQWLPWPAGILFACAVAVSSGAGAGVVAFTIVSLLYVLVSGYWIPTMNTLALVSVAVPLSLMVGLFGGIAVYSSRKARAPLFYKPGWQQMLTDPDEPRFFMTEVRYLQALHCCHQNRVNWSTHRSRWILSNHPEVSFPAKIDLNSSSGLFC